jgi:hypothetical protein
MPRTFPPHLLEEVSLMPGYLLFEIKVLQFNAELLLLGDEKTVSIDINKEFSFQRAGGVPGRFDPTADVRDETRGSGDFIFMCRARCVSASLVPGRFDIAFDDGSKLWVDFTDSDFEPLMFTGWSEGSPSKLEFLVPL